MIKIIFNDGESKTYNSDLYGIHPQDETYMIRKLESNGKMGKLVLWAPFTSVKYILFD